MRTLSILICAIPSRRKQFLSSLMDNLDQQIKTYKHSGFVQLVVLMDNKKMIVGEKRNFLLKCAKGDYVCFVDDDDRVSADYVRSLHEAIQIGPDCVTFNSEVRINGKDLKICYFNGEQNKNHSTHYERTPNHLCVVKREIATRYKFPERNFQEDDEYARRIYPYLKKKVHIDKILYYYDFDQKTTETQK
jgi:glycosyltransferase involved in cell wall biosynthesis